MSVCLGPVFEVRFAPFSFVMQKREGHLLQQGNLACRGGGGGEVSTGRGDVGVVCNPAAAALSPVASSSSGGGGGAGGAGAGGELLFHRNLETVFWNPGDNIDRF